MNASYTPKSFPEKAMLLGGGQLFNQFMVVNVLAIETVPNPTGKKGETALQATVEEQTYDGIKGFTPYLLSYALYPLDKKYANTPLDTYSVDSDKATGQHTGYILKR